MSDRPLAITGLARRETHDAEYRAHRDPIAADRLTWQANIFRHLVQSLPGETILEIGSSDGGFSRALVAMTRGRNPLVAVTAAGLPGSVPDVETVTVDSLPGPIIGRRFRYVVAQTYWTATPSTT